MIHPLQCGSFLIHVVWYSSRRLHFLLINVLYSLRDSWRCDYRQSQILIDYHFLMISSQLNKPVNVRELILIDYLMSE